MDRDKQLQTIRQQLQDRHQQLAGGLEESGNGNGDGNAYNPDRTDLANEYRSRERRTSLRAMEEKTLQQIERALAQIDEGTYGLCVQCHQPINVERLEVLPYATLCFSCQIKANTTK